MDNKKLTKIYVVREFIFIGKASLINSHCFRKDSMKIMESEIFIIA